METSLTAPNQQLVALTPAELPQTQAALADWCQQKMRALGQEYRELSANLRIAKKNRWSRGGLINAVGRTKKRIQYYQKMRAAVQAGYLIIPNLPAEIIAVRVKESRPYPPVNYGTYPTDVNEVAHDALPAGTGKYVDETSVTVDESYNESDGKGGTRLVRRVEAGHYRDEIDFPVIAVKPIIMEATARAMALRIFDDIGVAHGPDTTSRKRRRSDPIVVGRLHDPRSSRYNKRYVTFFIAWWLDTAVL